MESVNELGSIPRKSRVFIYGTGSAGKSLFAWLLKCRRDILIKGFIDSSYNGSFRGKTIYSLEKFIQRFSSSDYDLILIASGFNKEISEKLDSLNIHSYLIISVPTYLMENLFPLSVFEKFRLFAIRFKSIFFKRKIHLFFGEHGGKFIGNNKYFFLYIKGKIDAPIYWVAEDPSTIDELIDAHIPVLDFKDKNFHSYLYRAAFFYFDNMTWQRSYPWLRFFKAKIIHMSHGVGLKVTEKMLIPNEFMNALSQNEKKRVENKIFKNDLLISTSPFYAENVSAPAYSTPLEHITCSGYPKNDVFYSDIEGELLFSDSTVIHKIDQLKQDNYKIIVYAPTFRDMDSRFHHAPVIDYSLFDQYLRQNRMVLVIKGHTTLSGVRHTHHPESFSNIVFYRNDRDGYPLLKRADLLITDYSSIYMDFLHCQQPVIFFTYDYDEYIAKHRDIQFDYNQMTPGPKAQDYHSLIQWITRILVDREDQFVEARQKIWDLAYTYHDGLSSQRIFQKIKEM